MPTQEIPLVLNSGTALLVVTILVCLILALQRS